MASKRLNKKRNKRADWFDRKKIKTIPKRKKLNYWERRAIEKEIRVKDKTEAYLERLSELYKEATKGIMEDIKEHEENSKNDYIYINPFYALNNMVPKDEAQKTFNNMLAFSAFAGVSTLIPYQMSKIYSKGHLNRYKMLQMQVMNRLEILKQAELKGTVEHLKEVYKDTYIETANELYDDLTGVAFIEGMSLEDAEIFFGKGSEAISDKIVDEKIKEKWLGKSVEERIKDNNGRFSEEMQKIVISEIAQGKSVDKIAQTIQAKMSGKLSDAKRIARTESNRYLSDAAFECYKNAGVEEYIFLATLDYKTSEICQSLDQKVFKVEDRQIGVNCNPMHPNCRSTTAPKVDVDIPTRVARGSDGKGYVVDGKMNYKEWWNSLSKEERDKLELLKKAEKNKKRDKEQYNRLKKKLGNNAPKSFKEFQRIKYQEKEKFKAIKDDNVKGSKKDKRDANNRKKERIKKSKQKAIISKKVIDHPSYKEKFKKLGEGEEVTNAMYEESKNALKHRNKTLQEDLIFINSENGKVSVNNKSELKQEVHITQEQTNMLNNSKEFSIIAIHNHPESSPPSPSDFGVCWSRKYKYGLIACHDGKVIKYSIDHNIIQNEKMMESVASAYDNMLNKLNNEEFFSQFEIMHKKLREQGLIMEILE